MRKKEWCRINKTKIPCERIAVHIVKIITQKKKKSTQSITTLVHCTTYLKKRNIQKHKVRKGGRKKERLKGKREEVWRNKTETIEKKERNRKAYQRICSCFPTIRMSCFCVINRPKQLFLVSLPCHNVLTHYVFPNTFGMLGFPSESQYLRGWKQNLNTVRSLQMCSNFNTQWKSQLPWDTHYMTRDTPFVFFDNYLFII